MELNRAFMVLIETMQKLFSNLLSNLTGCNIYEAVEGLVQNQVFFYFGLLLTIKFILFLRVFFLGCCCEISA